MLRRVLSGQPRARLGSLPAKADELRTERGHHRGEVVPEFVVVDGHHRVVPCRLRAAARFSRQGAHVVLEVLDELHAVHAGFGVPAGYAG